MKRLDRILDFMSNKVSGHFSGWLIVIMTLVVLTEVLTRYVWRQPLMVADELSGYLLVAISFMGLAYTWKEKGHIRIRVLISRLPTRVARWLRLITLIAICVFVPVLTKALYDLVAYSWESGDRSFTTLRIPLLWPRMVMVIGAAMFFILILVELIKTIKAFRSGEAEEI